MPFWAPGVLAFFGFSRYPLLRPFLGREAAWVFVVDSFGRFCFLLLWCLRLFHTLEGRTRRRSGIPPGGRTPPLGRVRPRGRGLSLGSLDTPMSSTLFWASVCVRVTGTLRTIFMRRGALIAPPGPFHTHPRFFFFGGGGPSRPASVLESLKRQRCHSENGISYSENGMSNSKSCSENTQEISESSENR